MILSLLPLLLIMLQLIELTGGSCQLRVSSNTTTGGNEGGTPEMFQQIQLELQCDDQTCLVSDYYNTSCDTSTDTVLAQILGNNGVHLCEKSCINDNPKVAGSAQLQTTTKLVTVTSTLVNRFPPNSSYDMATTTLHKTSHNNMLNTIINPTISQNLGTPTPAIIPAVTSCSPCIQTISNIISKITETHVDKVHITITSTVRAPCMPTPISKESKSCNFTTKTIVSTVQPPSVSVQDVKVCSSTESSALGALLGISTVLLALVTAGWIWTCWIVKKRGRMVVNSKLNNFPSTPGTVTINNNTDTLRRLQNPLYEETVINGLLPPSEAELHTGQGENEETGPTYEIIPLPDPVKKASKKNKNIQLEKEETITVGGRVSVGAASSKNDDSIQGSVGGGNMNPYYLPGENTKGESSDRTGDGDQEDNYHLLGSAEEEREEGVRENVYHLVENPLDTEEDYADPDEEEMNNIYHVLEGPTPEWEEERERRDKAESEEEREREGVEREEPLTEPSAYEVPLSKHNSTVLQ